MFFVPFAFISPQDELTNYLHVKKRNDYIETD